MKGNILTTRLFLLSLNYSGSAQVTFQAHTGLGYIEHFSTGIGCTFSRKHTVALLYGSDLFIRTKNFSTYLIQYNLILHTMKFARITPTIGIKGGHTIYTDGPLKTLLISKKQNRCNRILFKLMYFNVFHSGEENGSTSLYADLAGSQPNHPIR